MMTPGPGSRVWRLLCSSFVFGFAAPAALACGGPVPVREDEERGLLQIWGL
jgi:hypothetical protein|uniref:Uncharacterized protein n=1 Tax=Picea sitchensis TaxID=3332 RepID=A0A6B9XUZ6_PICSI|nr:hypothetical protein Q903MT_gene3848 [Picea sitchensis]